MEKELIDFSNETKEIKKLGLEFEGVFPAQNWTTYKFNSNKFYIDITYFSLESEMFKGIFIIRVNYEYSISISKQEEVVDTIKEVLNSR